MSQENPEVKDVPSFKETPSFKAGARALKIGKKLVENNPAVVELKKNAKERTAEFKGSLQEKLNEAQRRDQSRVPFYLQDDEQVTLFCEFPGISPEVLQVEVKAVESSETDAEIVVVGVLYTGAKRTYTFRITKVDHNLRKITTEFGNGLLKVYVPKIQKAEEDFTIRVA